jgi:glycosyltransferase involved in cell wall biosynthesis
VSAGPDAEPLRIMIVTDQYAPMVGGVPTVTRELARGLAERGHRVSVVVPATSWRTKAKAKAAKADAEPDAPAAAGEPAVIRGRSVRWPWYEGARLGLLSPGTARSLLAKGAPGRPGVVHVHSPLTLGLAARRAARKHGIPLVYTNHYLPANVHPTPDQGVGRTPRGGTVFDALFYRYLTWFASGCDLVTAPSQTALGLLRGHGLRARSEVVSNGVDLGTYAAGPPDSDLAARYGIPCEGDDTPPVVLCVGRLSPEKRADLLIEALSLMADASVVLVLAGTGPDERRLRDRAASLNVAARVRFTGYVQPADLPGLYRLGTVFAVASEAELQSLVTMEAMAAALPVVAVAAGALPELVKHGENGMLARPGDAEGLAAALGQLCRDKDLRTAMGASSLRMIAAHDRHCQLARWEFLYRTLAPSGTDQAKVSDGHP